MAVQGPDRGRVFLRSCLLLAFVGCCLLAAAARADGAIVPTGFRDKTIVSGLAEPTAVAFAPDGRMFVAERSGTQ